MNVGIASNSFANAVAPFSPVGKQAVGEENTEDKNSTLKSIEESAETARNQNRSDRQEPEKTADAEVSSAKRDGEGNDKRLTGEGDEERAREKAQEQRQELQDREEISELSTRDREVRAHEQAHAAVGGRYAGSPSYQFERGPDGRSYAVSGEVPISTSKVANDPEATIDKAQQVRRAALAPAEPSPQDRRVASTASQMELEARQELVEMQQQEARLEREQRLEQQAQRDGEEQQRQLRSEETQQERSARESAFQEQSDLQRSFQQRLIDIGIRPSTTEAGSFISESV